MAYPSWLEKSLLLLSTVITVPGIIRGYESVLYQFEDEIYLWC
jgi:hypothetical protein